MRQLRDWALLYSIEPWGEVRDDLRMARLVWAVLQPHSKKNLSEEKFLFQWKALRAKDAPRDGDEHRRKAMRVWANASENGLKIAGLTPEDEYQIRALKVYGDQAGIEVQS